MTTGAPHGHVTGDKILGLRKNEHRIADSTKPKIESNHATIGEFSWF